jgi:tRNA(Ile)-lysidine synthetase-like protein
VSAIFDTVTAYVVQRQLLCSTDSVVVGFSSGPDSVFLLLWLVSFLESPSTQIHLIYYDHGLRSEAVLAEREMCVAYAQRYQVRLSMRRIPVRAYSESEGCSIETAGRYWRYRMLSHVARLSGVRTVLTGHHGDDVVETFFAQLLRGARSGLVGIRPKVTIEGCSLTVLARPLLAIGKSDILSFLQSVGADYSVDESNCDEMYRRNQIRHQLVPGCVGISSDYVGKIGGAVSYLQGVFDWLDEVALRSLVQVDVDAQGVVRVPRSVFLDLPDVVMGRAVVLFLKQYLRLEAQDKQIVEVQILQIVRLIKVGRGSTSLPESHRLDVESEWIVLY